MTRLSRRGAAAVLLCLTLAGCNAVRDMFREEEVPLEGERYTVLELEQQLEADPQIADLKVRLPKPQVNSEWPQPGGYPDHAMHHLALGDDPFETWVASVSGSDSERAVLAEPVVADGKVFVMDADSEIHASDAESGSKLWSVDPLPEEDEGGDLGGGIAYWEGRIYATTGAAQVVAFDAENGEELWRSRVTAPMRAGPAVSDGRVFTVGVDNQSHALDADTGELIWNHQGLEERAGILGGATPAVDGPIVIVPHSSGDIFALRTDNGRPLWSDGIAAARRINAVAQLSDIRGHPVIDRGRVFAVSHSGRMASIDLRTGARIWDIDIGAMQTPWVAGDFVYVLTTDGQLVCAMRDSGRIRWAVGLENFVDDDDLDEFIFWVGPVLAGDRLIVAGSHGEALSISPYTGAAIGWIPLPEGVVVTPVVANETLYLFDNDGELAAMK